MENENFSKIIKEHQRLIYKIAYSYCPDQEDRKDLQQDILIQLWKAYPGFDGRVKLSTWIYRIALNTAITFYRKDKKRQRNRPLDETVISLPDENKAFQDENIRELHRHIELLNELEKALIILYLEDASYRDMSEVLGISESNVGTKINRIKQKLKEEFNKD